ncbi:MAG: hypothetical protein K2J46_04085, partial [Muribaculaceae bacterium]|nr:hypothetical protein [Muribaculaceae bacterium]
PHPRQGPQDRRRHHIPTNLHDSPPVMRPGIQDFPDHMTSIIWKYNTSNLLRPQHSVEDEVRNSL